MYMDKTLVIYSSHDVHCPLSSTLEFSECDRDSHTKKYESVSKCIVIGRMHVMLFKVILYCA